MTKSKPARYLLQLALVLYLSLGADGLEDGLYHLVYGRSSAYDPGCQEYYLGYRRFPSNSSNWGYAQLLHPGTLNPPVWQVSKSAGSPSAFTITAVNVSGGAKVQLTYEPKDCSSMLVTVDDDRKSTWKYENKSLIAAAKTCPNDGYSRIYFGLSDVIPAIFPPPGCTERSMGMLPYPEYWTFVPYIPYPMGPIDLYGYRTTIYDEIGQAVGLSGKTMVAGGRKQAYVFYRKSPEEWQRGRVVRPRSVPQTSLFGASVATSEGLVVVGAPEPRTSAAKAGSAVVYSTKGSSSKVLGVISGAAAGAGKLFGSRVGLNGSTIVIGDPGGAGAVYIYSTKELAKPVEIMKQPVAAVNELYLSRFVSLHGKKLAIAASSADSTISGKIHIFEKSPTTGKWLLQASLSCPGGTGSVCSAGNLSSFPNLNLYLWNDTLAAAHNGVVHVYDYKKDKNWTLKQRIKGNGPKFGSSLAHENGVLVAGEYYTGADAKKSRVSVWSRTADFPGGVWEDRGEIELKYPVSGDGFGKSAVAVYGDVVAIGAPGWKKLAGTVYAFRNPALFYITM